MITHQVKNWTILILFVLLAVSGTINILQLNSAKREQQARIIDHERSNTIIAGKEAVIEQKDIAIATIRKSRTVDSLASTKKIGTLNVRLARYEKKLSVLPKQVPYSPDSAMVDSLRLAFIFKDSTIDTQKLKISQLETDITAQFESFSKEIKEIQEQRESQVDISNQLQTQLVSAQTQTRKEVRRKKFFRTLSVISLGAVGVLLLKPN